MTGFELRLWRKSLGWSRERAAEELGVCLRSYKDYENASEVKRAIALATITLSVKGMMPLISRPQISKSKALEMLQRMLPRIICAGQSSNNKRDCPIAQTVPSKRRFRTYQTASFSLKSGGHPPLQVATYRIRKP